MPRRLLLLLPLLLLACDLGTVAAPVMLPATSTLPPPTQTASPIPPTATLTPSPTDTITPAQLDELKPKLETWITQTSSFMTQNMPDATACRELFAPPGFSTRC